MSFRDVPEVKLAEPPAPIVGESGRITWLPLDLLIVDDRFQRPVREAGRVAIRRIAAEFSWQRFTPLIVARVTEGEALGKYAIVDGQHRAAAAKARGDLAELPCWLIAADLAEQAKAFMAINSGVKVSALAVWHASHAAHDPDALHLFDVANKAGVEIARYPVAADRRPANMAMNPDEIMRLLKVLGDAPVKRALRLLRLAGEAVDAPLIGRALMRPLAQLCASQVDLFEDTHAVHVLSEIEPASFDASASSAARSSGRPAPAIRFERLKAAIMQRRLAA